VAIKAGLWIYYEDADCKVNKKITQSQGKVAWDTMAAGRIQAQIEQKRVDSGM
jgi:hypothetical protein